MVDNFGNEVPQEQLQMGEVLDAATQDAIARMVVQHDIIPIRLRLGAAIERIEQLEERIERQDKWISLLLQRVTVLETERE